jgi:tRNA-dependent cyclodipeptide synthase
MPNVRLGVSMGNPNFSGDKLKALVAWVATNDKNLTVQLTDSLNHHNNGGDRAAARAMGDAWLGENAAALATVSYSLVRWDDLLTHPDYPTAHAQVQQLYEQDGEFAAALNEAAIGFASRDKGRTTDQFIGYALEEAAGYASVWRGEQHIKLYPAKQSPWWQLAKAHLAAPTPAEHWAFVRFK